MAEQVRVVKVVVVSPSDVPGERAVAQTVVDELNRGTAQDRGSRVSLWRWETDARPGPHLEGPQGLIDEAMRIEDADIVVGVFWKRFGTPTRDADSGTEHELRRAWAAWTERGRPDVLVYFCNRAYSPETSAELAQHQRVIEFRQALPKEQLWWPYAEVPEFERLLREHLTRFLLSRLPARQARPVADPVPPSVTHVTHAGSGTEEHRRIDMIRLTTFLAPFLGPLLQTGEAALETAATRSKPEAVDHASDLWRKLAPSVAERPAVQDTARELGEHARSPRRRRALAEQLEAVLADDDDLARDVAAVWERANAAGVVASGDGAIAVGGAVSGSVFVTGDNASIEQ